VPGRNRRFPLNNYISGHYGTYSITTTHLLLLPPVALLEEEEVSVLQYFFWLFLPFPYQNPSPTLFVLLAAFMHNMIHK